MSDNKPPMTVWLNDDTCTAFEYGLRGVCRGSKDNVHDVGPYVHMEQFLEEVERRAKQICNASRKGDWVCDSMVNHHLYTSDAMQELAKEIAEGKG